jgi:hypothetical protein
MMSDKKLVMDGGVWRYRQGCQIFVGTRYQNGEIITNENKIYQMATKYFTLKDPPKFTQIGIFWLENIPTGTPGYHLYMHRGDWSFCYTYIGWSVFQGKIKYIFVFKTHWATRVIINFYSDVAVTHNRRIGSW